MLVVCMDTVAVLPRATNVGHSNFMYVLFKKFISSDITAFKQTNWQVCWYNIVGSVTGFLDDFNRRKDF